MNIQYTLTDTAFCLKTKIKLRRKCSYTIAYFQSESPNENTRRDFGYCWPFHASNSAIDENR